MVGKILKSKINGNLFSVKEQITERGKKYYIIEDIATGNTTCWGKEWFEKGVMKNLEVVEGV